MATKNTEFIDHRAEVLAQLNGNISRATSAVGTEAVGMIVSQMNNYPHKIYKTGDLQRDVNYEAKESDGKAEITVGNGLDYAIHVHEGTSKMAGRPYIRDGLQNGWDRLKQVWAANLKEGF